MRLTGDAGKSLDDMLEAAGDLGGPQLDDLLEEGPPAKPSRSLDDVLAAEPKKKRSLDDLLKGE